ncbi:uncharacterized protein [Spinacia oleracea]|uniref:MULE transposase domain-containing protein n=1 Tax=Spinacia oleracea TaxID=3562 RepID=A0ABM3QXC4_SPIOL|nr:uncharacterized protein LOC110805911 [Spinacia oleracea]
MNKKVTAEYIAERYLEDFRGPCAWKIMQVQERAHKDLGIEIRYYKAFLARCRANIIICGSASEQYARVWDYARDVMECDPRTGCQVVVNGIEQPEPPRFLRMFIFLAPLRDGFRKGCRPIIGVDGCHLKGAYPAQILVAVSKDGNNNIFPMAWATVEIENKETWEWFLEALMSMLGGVQGLGFTFMSDRQKGLLEAFQNVVPKAETRYCLDFEVAMECINFLSEDAHEYLANIPTQHWSRHAFSPNCKSNMLLNNMCETFNAVIKEAREKPILTQMEWLRRYMMKRSNDKWEATKKMEGNLVPYVKSVFDGFEKLDRSCIVQVSRGDSYEVELKGDQCVFVQIFFCRTLFLLLPYFVVDAAILCCSWIVWLVADWIGVIGLGAVIRDDAGVRLVVGVKRINAH